MILWFYFCFFFLFFYDMVASYMRESLNSAHMINFSSEMILIKCAILVFVMQSKLVSYVIIIAYHHSPYIVASCYRWIWFWNFLHKMKKRFFFLFLLLILHLFHHFNFILWNCLMNFKFQILQSKFRFNVNFLMAKTSLFIKINSVSSRHCTMYAMNEFRMIRAYGF